MLTSKHRLHTLLCLALPAQPALSETTPKTTPPEAAVTAPKPDADATHSADAQALVTAQAHFTTKLFLLMDAQQLPQANLAFSPYSIHTALGMTQLGARGETLEQMRASLQVADMKGAEHASARALVDALSATPQVNEGQVPAEVAIANRVWVEATYPLEQAYTQALDTQYKAPAAQVSFITEPEPARLQINKWVAEQTKEHIKDLLPAGLITDLTRMVLTNAVYFKGAWVHKFNASATKPGDFTRLDNVKVKAPMMTLTKSLRYEEDDTMQAVVLPYQGDTMELVAVLPKPDKRAEVINALGQSLSTRAGQQVSYRSIALTLPKLSFRTKTSLKEVLTALGMDLAFSDDADFSGMSLKAKDEPIKISEVVHEAFIQVDEKGSEAAAATAVIMVALGMAINPEQPLEVRLDRPFFFAIREVKSGALLFVGSIIDPTQK